MKRFKQFLMEDDTTPTSPIISTTPLPKGHKSGRYVRDHTGKIIGEIDAYSLPPGVAGTAQQGPPSPEQTDPITKDPVPSTEEYSKKFPRKKK